MLNIFGGLHNHESIFILVDGETGQEVIDDENSHFTNNYLLDTIDWQFDGSLHFWSV